MAYFGVLSYGKNAFFYGVERGGEMKRVRQVVLIGLFVVGVMVIRGWALQRQATPLAKRFAIEIEIFESEYGEGLKSAGDERVLLSYDLGQKEKRFLVAGEGYEDWILLNVVIAEDQVVDVTVAYSQETDGYGSYVEDEWFLSRTLLKTISPFELVKYRKEAPNEVVAITGATETSQGVVDAINACIKIEGGERK